MRFFFVQRRCKRQPVQPFQGGIAFGGILNYNLTDTRIFLMLFSSGACTEDPTIDGFDLLEFQQRARETCCPKKLFQLWEDISRRYERGEIGQYEVDEMKEVIWPTLEALASIRRSVNGEVALKQRKYRKRA
jgi:hypothetical protein